MSLMSFQFILRVGSWQKSDVVGENQLKHYAVGTMVCCSTKLLHLSQFNHNFTIHIQFPRAFPMHL